ncbi:MAG TPA: hypothetical protein VMZ31_20755 [Phycisphaerae bacterium]|nr:hypothetical protein [Phycisphaerae bacterium]
MMKWFRKHNKKLLAVFASGLLVVWLGGTALQQTFSRDPSKEVLAEVLDQKVRMRTWRVNLAKVNILQNLRLPWQMVAYQMIPGDFYSGAPEVDTYDWLCLSREAERMGVQISREQVEQFLSGQQGMAQRIDMLRENREVALAFVYDSVADFLRVITAARLAMQGVDVAEPRVRLGVRDAYEKVHVKLVALRADEFLDPNEVLTDAELQEHFETYKDVLPGEDERLGYGYRWPDRVRVEYLVADIDQIKEAQPETMVRRVESRALKYYREHPDEFTVSEPATTTAAATEPASSMPTTSSQPVTRLKSYGEVTEQLVDRLMTEQAMKVAGQLIQRASERLQEPWYEVRPDKDGYKQAPPTATEAGHMSDLAAEISGEGVPLLYRSTELLTSRDAAAVPGIGMAYARDENNRPLPFSQYIFRVKGLAAAPMGPGASLRLSPYEPTRSPLRDGSPNNPRNFYIFRVTEVSPSQVPQSLEEVRPRVEADLREYKAYLRAGEQVEQLAAAAADSDLSAAVEQAEVLKEKLGDQLRALEPAPFPRVQPLSMQMVQFGMTQQRPPLVTGIGSSKEFVEACFDLAEAAENGVSPIRTVALPKLKRQAVVQWVETERVTEQLYQERRAQVAQTLQLEVVRTFRNDWFDSQRIRERTGFKLISEE